jgi:hypothetical protein
MEPPASKTLSASSLDGFPKGQVETSKGVSPFFGEGSAPCVSESVTAPSRPAAVPLTNRRLDILICQEGRLRNTKGKVKGAPDYPKPFEQRLSCCDQLFNVRR